MRQDESMTPREHPHPYFAGTAAPRVLAHRGLVTPELAAAGVAENSLAAIEAAASSGADFVESDCRLTRDGVVVLWHDADLGSVLGDPRPVSDVDSRELAEMMAGRGGLATLEAALVGFPEARFNLDIKSAQVAAPAGRLLAPHAERVLVTSFSDRYRRAALSTMQAEGSARPATSPGRGALIGLLAAIVAGVRTPRVLRGFDALQIPEYQGRVRVLSPRLVSAAHRAGVEVHVWTVNDPARMRQLVAMGVDGIITDRADIALAELRD